VTRPVVLTTLLALAAAASVARAVVKSSEGLRAEYVADSQAGRQARIIVDREISTDAITRAWGGTPPPQFRARWTGYLVVPKSGVYTFATTSDDGSAVTIDNARVVDNLGDHAAQTRTGRVQLQRGSHAVVIDYSQVAGQYELSWSWGGEGSSLSPVPAWALWTRRTSYWRTLGARAIDPLLALVLVAAGVVAIRVAWDAKGRDVARALRRWWEGVDLRSAIWRPRRAVTKRVLLSLASLVIALFAAEVFARVIFRAVRSSGDARTFFATRGEPTPLNNLGYRDIDVPPKSPRYRIVVIGDSITWGVGLSEQERFSNLLQRFLGSDYEVFNFGIPGHNLPEHLQTLDTALAISPDFVLLQLYTNDFEIGDMERPRARPLLPGRAADRWLLSSSALYTMLSAQWPRIQEKLGWLETYEHYMYRYLGDPKSPEAAAGMAMLHQFVARAREAGVPVGTVMFPNPGVLGRDYQFAYLHDRVAAFCADERIHCVDLRGPFLTSFKDLREIVVSPFDGHPSARASLVAADQILAEFRPLWHPCALRAGDMSCRERQPPSVAHAPAQEQPRPFRRVSRRRRAS
jgi:lysophospholipase L1-like esterase